MNYVVRIKSKLALRNRKAQLRAWWSSHSKTFRFSLASAGIGVLIGIISLFTYILTSTYHGAKPGGNSPSASDQQAGAENEPSGGGTASPSASQVVKDSRKPVPASILNLTNWKLTLPVDTAHSGSPDEIKQSELATYINNSYFKLNNAKNGVVFRAPVGGATTSNSGYPRSELREMASSGSKSASWSSTKGTHTMTIRQAITHLPSAKPQVVAGQIHDASDDVIMIRLDGSVLYVEANGDSIGTLNPKYKLGSVFTVKIVVKSGHIKVYYDGKPKVDYVKKGSGYYFKAGCYTQSNTSKGDSPSAYGEVVIYSLQVSHK